MPKPAKYNANTPAPEFLKVLGRLKACDESLVLLHSDFSAQKLPNTSLIEVCNKLPDQGWASWLLSVFGDDMSEDIRQALISKITDPMMAFRLYLDLPFLTDEEDKLLEAKFKGRLPQAEQELKDGIVTRAKWQ